VPKIASPEIINDYRHTGVKFLSKMVVDSLQQGIISCVHKNQYGFIKGRNIHDYVGWSFEYLHQCKMSKREILVLKLDFEKAFDSIEHKSLYMVLRQMGFPDLFISWAKSLLEMARLLFL
jgi:retron-type reverse transcriptase